MNDFRPDNISSPKGRRRDLKLYLLIASVPVFVYQSLATKDYWTLLFISCLALFAPILWTAFAIYVCYKLLGQFHQNHLVKKEFVQNTIVRSVQLNRLDDLIQAIEANPDILYCDYQRRSLIAWCRYYKNTKAQELIMQMMKKYPKESIAA